MTRRTREFAEMRIGPLPVVPIIREDSRWDSNHEDEPEFWPRTFWIDPGVTSGIACTWFDPKALIEGKPIPRVVLATTVGYLHGPENKQAHDFITIAEQLNRTPGLAIGSENFRVAQFNSSEEFLSPVRIRSKLDFYYWRGGQVLWDQSPSEAKTSITDERLTLWNMYVPGPDHIRDALRHNLLWLRKLRNVGREGLIRWHGNESDWWED